MTIKDLEDGGLILLKCISGSKAYGLDLPSSDTDIKGVFLLPKAQFYSLDYIAQVSDEKNDEVYYELGRFIELLSKNNPNILELLATPSDKVLYRHPIMDKVKAELFLSKKCKDTFGGYAFAQIKKARGLNKKIVNPVAKEKKSVLDFCYVLADQGAVSIHAYLEKRNLEQSEIGLVSIPHFKDTYGIYYDEQGDLNYKGIMRKVAATTVLLSSVPKGEKPIGHLSFNQDGYVKYCKDYRDYWDWVAKRNEVRYENNLEHGKNYDSKNMMHTFRLLDMAEEILLEGKVKVERPNRTELLEIRQGKRQYDELIVAANQKMAAITLAYHKSELPASPNQLRIKKLLFEMREALYP